MEWLSIYCLAEKTSNCHCVEFQKSLDFICLFGVCSKAMQFFFELKRMKS